MLALPLGNTKIRECYWGLGYSLCCKQAIMESFNIESACRTSFSTFNFTTMSVTGKFLGDNGFLDKVEAEFSVKLAFDAAATIKADVVNLGACDALDQALRQRQKDDIFSISSRSGTMRYYSQSTGNSSN